MYLGQTDRGHVNNCAVCGKSLMSPGYGRTSANCCGKSQPWYTYIYQDVETLYISGRWYIVRRDDHDRPLVMHSFNAGPGMRSRGYACERSAARAWKNYKSQTGHGA